MKMGKNIVYILGALIVVAALYRVVPGRPYGFAPQIAMALFAGALVKNKATAFILPLLSMFLADALFQLLYVAGISPLWGFYEGQFTNYLLFTLLTVFGFLIKKINIRQVAAASVAAPTVYFLLSNFMVWISGGGYQRPKTFEGLMMAYNDGLPFYWNSIAGTLFFSGLFFGGYYLVKHYMHQPEAAQ
ncbi:MAG: hypothetical protein M9904_13020 [Chitinophagaceae bacterium]|nr:hypothetical protein [Chitinophagaceae bacterium]